MYFCENIFNIPIMSVYSVPEHRHVALENYTENTKPCLKSVFIFSAELLL